MNPLGSIGAHPTYTQEQIAGVRPADGSFMSNDSAEYLNERFQTIAAIIHLDVFLPSDRIWIWRRLKPLSQSNHWATYQSTRRMEAAVTPNQIGAGHFDQFQLLSTSYVGTGFQYCCKLS